MPNACLTGKGLLPPARARTLKNWKHFGFTVHRSRRIQSDEREDLERVARCIIRNPFSTDTMAFKPPNRVNAGGTVIYRSGMSPKIHRNFQIFTPCSFIGAITRQIPDTSVPLVRYYGWYSNNMRGQRNKRAREEAEELAGEVEVIEVSEHQPRRIPSPKWRELIKKV